MHRGPVQAEHWHEEEHVAKRRQAQRHLHIAAGLCVEQACALGHLMQPPREQRARARLCMEHAVREIILQTTPRGSGRQRT